MTEKEWQDILIRLKTEKKPIRVDWIKIYPPAIKFIQDPSDFMKESQERYRYNCIHFYPERESVIIAYDEYIKAKSRRYNGDEGKPTPKLNIHYKHIKEIKISWR